MIMDKGVTPGKVTYVIAAAAGVGAATVIFCWHLWNCRAKNQKVPSKWRRVGDLADIVMYPVKSMGPIRVQTLDCTIMGPKVGQIGDRNFMAIDSSGHFVTARQYPKFVQISPKISDTVLTLTAPRMTPLIIDVNNLKGKKGNFQTTVFGAPVVCRDCGDEVAKWLSRAILQKDDGFRLVYYPLNYPTREKVAREKVFTLIDNKDTGVYADNTSFSLINNTSVMDLNNRLEEPVTPSQFRMNFLVKNAKAYEEDQWDWIKVGNVVFRNIRPCTRCIMTTINPDRGEKHEKTEPLNSLKGYRQITDSNLRRFVGESPVMGIHLGLKGPPGIVRLNDPVYVGVK